MKFAVENSNERKVDDIDQNLTSMVLNMLSEILENEQIKPEIVKENQSYYDK